MNREAAIEVLRRHKHELRARGVQHAALFGSVARGEANLKSDLDILLDLSPNARLDAFDYVELKRYIGGLFEVSVDVVTREGLKPHVRESIIADVIPAF